MKRPLILVPIGDVAGIGPEIVCKAFAEKDIFSYSIPVAVGSQKAIERILSLCRIPLTVKVLNRPEDALGEYGSLEMINAADEDALAHIPFGEVNAQAGNAAYAFIRKTCELLMDHHGDAMATTPINKESFRAAGIPFIGHTEAIGELMHASKPLTMFQVYNLRVFFMSRHLSLKDAVAYITKDRTLSFIRDCHESMKELGVPDPSLAMAGLNPHCGEHGLFGDEEMVCLTPAIEEAQKEGINITGPIGADSVFWQGRQGRFDAVLSLYHDQGHIATKTVDFEKTISITMGLPKIRTSVDHGTAFDIAGKNMASAVSMIEAIRLAASYVRKE